MGGRKLTAQWECFLPLGNAAISHPGNAPASDLRWLRTHCLSGPYNLAVNAGRGSDRDNSFVDRRRRPMSRASLICTISHRRLLAARQALENMPPGAKSVRCINSWPQLLVRPLDSGVFSGLQGLPYQLSDIASTHAGKPAQCRFPARPRRQGYFPFDPLPRLPYLPA